MAPVARCNVSWHNLVVRLKLDLDWPVATLAKHTGRSESEIEKVLRQHQDGECKGEEKRR